MYSYCPIYTKYTGIIIMLCVITVLCVGALLFPDKYFSTVTTSGDEIWMQQSMINQIQNQYYI